MHEEFMAITSEKYAAIAPIGFTFRGDRSCKEFKAFVEEYGNWKELPVDTFKDSGTSVATVMLWMTKR